MTTLQQPTPDCSLTDSPSYAELLSIHPLAAVPGSHHLVIRSRLDSAKDPQGLHTRYSVTLSRAAIERLHAHLGKYLAATQAPPSEQPETPLKPLKSLEGKTPKEQMQIAKFVRLMLETPPDQRAMLTEVARELATRKESGLH